MKPFFIFRDDDDSGHPVCVAETYQVKLDTCAADSTPNPEFTLTTEDGGGGPIRPITLQLAKNKDGTIGEWPLWLDAGYFRFRESWPNHGQVPEKCPRKIPAE